MMSIFEALESLAPPFGIFIVLASITGLITTALAATRERKAVAAWYLLGVTAVIIKIWLIQMAPQWADVSLDSQLYKVHAEAFSLHWQDQSVDAQVYRLNGFLNGWDSSFGPLWRPDMQIPYASVFGTYEWLYAAFLGSWRLVTTDWQFWAMYSNAAFAGAFPAASFGIVRHLGGSPRVAAVAALATLIDPSIGVNAAWLLKDTLAGLFAVIAIWATLKTLRTPGWSTVLILCVAATGLSLTRFAAYAALLLSLVLLLSFFFSRISSQTISRLGIAAIGSAMFFGVFYSIPKIPTPTMLVGAILTPVSAQKDTLVASKESNEAYDPSVAIWHEHLTKDPIGAIFTSAARSLFAPYPWVIVSHGLSGTNGTELYYLGMPIWILCLPGILWGALICIRMPNGGGFFVACVLLALLSAYTLFLGEWSTRQRVFMLPVFFAYAAIGWNDLRSKYRDHCFLRQGKCA